MPASSQPVQVGRNEDPLAYGPSSSITTRNDDIAHERSVLDLDGFRGQRGEERITAHRRVVERFNEQTSKPQTRKDVKRLLCDYNNLYNEGGSGWLSWIVCREDAEQAAQWLGEHGIRVTVG